MPHRTIRPCPRTPAPPHANHTESLRKPHAVRLSNLADYAVVMLAAAARKGEGLGARVTATELAGTTKVPLATAQKVLGQLAAAGLLTSGRGSRGGFALARPAAAISVADIVEAMEGPIALAGCVTEADTPCALTDHCRVKPHWPSINDAVRGALAGVSLAHLSAGTP